MYEPNKKLSFACRNVIDDKQLGRTIKIFQQIRGIHGKHGLIKLVTDTKCTFSTKFLICTYKYGRLLALTAKKSYTVAVITVTFYNEI